MSTFDLFWLALLVQVFGLLSIVATRLLIGRCERSGLCQAVFFGALLLVGMATVMLLFAGSGQWIGCGATLAIMVVGATLDFGHSRKFSSI